MTNVSDQNNADQLRNDIKKWRHEIRWHRDQVGDNRCWLDDEKLYKSLPTKEGLQVAPSPDIFKKLCVEFWENRQCPTETTVVKMANDQNHPAAVLSSDDDLVAMTLEQLQVEWQKLFEGVRVHQLVPRHERRWHHDKELYFLLPEKQLAVWRLPNRDCFLESCEHFIESCQKHPSKLHAWEPDELA